jgi:hypothetical protein
VYNYTIKEISAPGGGWLMDDSVYPVVVKVAWRGASLVASVEYPDGEPIFVNCKCAPKGDCRKTMLFCADSDFAWWPGRNLELHHDCPLLCGVKLVRGPHGRHILLPPCTNFTVNLDFELINPCGRPVIIELRHTRTNGKEILVKTYEFKGRKITLWDCIALESQEYHESLLSLRLLSENPLEIRKANLEIRN